MYTSLLGCIPHAPRILVKRAHTALLNDHDDRKLKRHRLFSFVSTKNTQNDLNFSVALSRNLFDRFYISITGKDDEIVAAVKNGPWLLNALILSHGSMTNLL